jgi:hypothetical protein
VFSFTLPQPRLAITRAGIKARGKVSSTVTFLERQFIAFCRDRDFITRLEFPVE